MKRFGPGRHQMHPIKEEELFLSHLHLLIVMVKAALKGYPIGELRKNAAVDTAKTVHHLVSTIDMAELSLKTSSHLFRERVKLLSVMATAIVSETYPLGIHRRKAVLENIRMVGEYAFPRKHLKLFDEMLKVA